jgi:3-hydroxyacyl-CoA dehydrogenase
MIDRIATVAVLGSGGTIGSLSGGLLAQNGLRVYFLSRTPERAQQGLQRAIAQARSEVIAEQITCGDYDSLLEEACAKADWILECVAEDMTVKQSMYALVDEHRREESVVSTVTSSLVLEELPQGRSESFRQHFLSTHFYNPPGKMPACEISSQSQTDPAVLERMAEFLERRLGRAVIPVKPSAAFAGNRIAFLLFARIVEMAAEYGVEMMDYLIGPYTGRIMSPLATIDLVGLDIHRAILRSLQQHTHDAMHDKLTVPDYLNTMIEMGCLGRKTRNRGGFYKRLESGQYEFFDPETCSYIPTFEPHVKFVETAKHFIHLGRYREAFATIFKAKGTEADLVKEILATYISYAYMLVGTVTEETYGITGIDRVMTTGFNWAGPSMIVHMLGGKERAIGLLEANGLTAPESLREDSHCEQIPFNAGKYFPAR